MPNQESDRKAKQIEAISETVRFFGSGNKPERERWAVLQLLRCLQIEHDNDEVVSAPDEPPDLLFRSARFEVKEVQDDDRRRHAEYKAELDRVLNSVDGVDLTRQVTPVVLTLKGIHESCYTTLAKYQTHYSAAVRRSLDALIYVNFQGAFWFRRGRYPSNIRLQRLGWRSISFVTGSAASCVMAEDDAPSFLKAAVGRYVRDGGSKGVREG